MAKDSRERNSRRRNSRYGIVHSHAPEQPRKVDHRPVGELHTIHECVEEALYAFSDTYNHAIDLALKEGEDPSELNRGLYNRGNWLYGRIEEIMRRAQELPPSEGIADGS